MKSNLLVDAPLVQLRLLLQALPKNRRDEFEAYIDQLVRNDEHYGIDHTFLGFIVDYYYLSRILQQHIIQETADKLIFIPARNFLVFDIGCAAAVQHVFFSKCSGYVGIDMSIGPQEPKFFCDNCTFISGRFADLVKSGELKIPDDAFGIANMSLLYQYGNEEDIEWFNEVFKHKFII
jgi:hypothetical protein